MQADSTAEVFRKAFQKWAEGKKRGFQADISRKADVSPVIVNEIFRGKRPGTEEQRRAIARVLGYKYDDFLQIGMKETGTLPANSPAHTDEVLNFIGALKIEKDQLDRMLERLRRIPNLSLPTEEQEKVNRLLQMADKILSSNNIVLREALKTNLIAFSEDLDRIQEIREITERVAANEAKTSREIKELRKEVEALKKTIPIRNEH